MDFLENSSIKIIPRASCSEKVSKDLFEIFEVRWFRRLGPWNWHARSPDLTRLDLKKSVEEPSTE